jgi:hypothetical protein
MIPSTIAAVIPALVFLRAANSGFSYVAIRRDSLMIAAIPSAPRTIHS